MKYKKTVVVCDECKNEMPTTPVRIVVDGRAYRLDLCSKAMGPVTELVRIARQARPRQQQVRVADMEPVELPPTPRKKGANTRKGA